MQPEPRKVTYIMVVYEELHEGAVVSRILQLLLDLIVTEDLEDRLCLCLLAEKLTSNLALFWI